MSTIPLEFNNKIAQPLVDEISKRSGQNISACYQCRRCAAGCPVGEKTGGFTPDRLIRTIILGDRETMLDNLLIYKCVSCYTCGTRCPNDIRAGRITETIKKIIKENNARPEETRIINFHTTFLNSGLRWGRVNELEFMSFFEIKNALNALKRLQFKNIYDSIISQTRLGFSMLKKNRLHFSFHSAKGRKEIKKLYKNNKKKPKKNIVSDL